MALALYTVDLSVAAAADTSHDFAYFGPSIFIILLSVDVSQPF